jgi:ABC-type sugar transport system ATPase subunit
LKYSNNEQGPEQATLVQNAIDSKVDGIAVTLSSADAVVPVSKKAADVGIPVAIARAVYFGARVLILDEPTAALGVKQSGVVLTYTAAARDAGLGVVFITHNPHHAFMVGDHFIILKLGRRVLDKKRSEVTLEELTAEMAGGQELAELSHELKR